MTIPFECIEIILGFLEVEVGVEVVALGGFGTPAFKHTLKKLVLQNSQPVKWLARQTERVFRYVVLRRWVRVDIVLVKHLTIEGRYDLLQLIPHRIRECLPLHLDYGTSHPRLIQWAVRNWKRITFTTDLVDRLCIQGDLETLKVLYRHRNLFFCAGKLGYSRMAWFTRNEEVREWMEKYLRRKEGGIIMERSCRSCTGRSERICYPEGLFEYLARNNDVDTLRWWVQRGVVDQPCFQENWCWEDVIDEAQGNDEFIKFITLHRERIGL